MTNADVCIVGAGAAGLICAYNCAARGLKTIVFDPNKMVGRKVRITGKGRCNVTNNCDVKTFLNNVPVNGKFLYSAVTRFSPTNVMDFFERNGLPLKTERGNRVFPVSDNANDVADLLFRMCREKKVEFIRTVVTDIQKDDYGFRVETQSSKFYARAVAVCTGGLSYPLTGTTGAGYRFAAKFGHSIIEPHPSLIPLECYESYCEEMQGFSLKNVVLSAFEDDKLVYKELGEMIFTHFGVSGPLVLSASSHMRYIGKKNYRLEIDLKPALDEKKLDERILRDFQKYINKDFRNALNDLAGRSMIPVIVRLSGINPDAAVNSITRDQRLKLVHLFKHFPLSVSGTRPIDEAIITSGGICTTEINPRTMESKIAPGLYFAGEVIDVDAYTGGFNLQIAWSTGFVAGNSILKDEYYYE